MPPYSKRRQYQVLNLAGKLRFKGKLPRGILCVRHPCNWAYGVWPEHIIQNAYFQQLPPLTRLPSSYFIQNASQNSSWSIRLKKKNQNQPPPQEIEMQRLHEVSLHHYLHPACTIPLIPLCFWIKQRNRATKNMDFNVTGKHPENKATEISGNFRTSCAKMIYQVHIGGAWAEVWAWHWLWVSDSYSDPQIIPCSQIKLRRYLFFFLTSFLHIPLLGKQNQSRELPSLSQLLLSYFQTAALSQQHDTAMFEPNMFQND